MESIQQIAEKFIQEIIELDVTEGLTRALMQAGQITNGFICRVIEYKLQALDQAIFDNGNYRPNWCVIHKDVPRSLQTKFGLIQFCRRYYQNRKAGDYKHLVDDMVGIDPGERVEVGLSAELVEAATSHSYAKSSEICCGSQVSRQTVMCKTRQVHSLELEKPEIRHDVKEIHIQADEDHVAMQDGRRDTIVKLVAIHEPKQRVSAKRSRLPQRHLLTSYGEKTGDFWLRVANEISNRYGDRDDLTIYIHGDGARWIRSGTEWLQNSYFVLDKFHVSQKLNRVVGGDEGLKQYVWDCMHMNELQNIAHLTEAIVNSEGCAEKTGEEFVKYIRNNWDGIQIWYDEHHNAGSSCAEGLVSHFLSSRLSSRPCGWLDQGLETISRLRVHVQNGGRITAANLKMPNRPAVRPTKILRQAMKLGSYHRSSAMHSDHRSSSNYRLFRAITDGGYKF